MPRWTQSEYDAWLTRRNQTRTGLFDPQSQRVVPNEPVAAPKGKTESPARIIVRIKSCRCRLLDPDNLCPKYVIDALRYAGAIPNDREADIILEMSQERVATRGDQRTLVELIKAPSGVVKPDGACGKPAE